MDDTRNRVKNIRTISQPARVLEIVLWMTQETEWNSFQVPRNTKCVFSCRSWIQEPKTPRRQDQVPAHWSRSRDAGRPAFSCFHALMPLAINHWHVLFTAVVYIWFNFAWHHVCNHAYNSRPFYKLLRSTAPAPLRALPVTKQRINKISSLPPRPGSSSKSRG